MHPVRDGSNAQHFLQQSRSPTVDAGGRGGGKASRWGAGKRAVVKKTSSRREVERKKVMGMNGGRKKPVGREEGEGRLVNEEESGRGREGRIK